MNEIKYRLYMIKKEIMITLVDWLIRDKEIQ